MFYRTHDNIFLAAEYTPTMQRVPERLYAEVEYPDRLKSGALSVLARVDEKSGDARPGVQAGQAAEGDAARVVPGPGCPPPSLRARFRARAAPDLVPQTEAVSPWSVPEVPSTPPAPHAAPPAPVQLTANSPSPEDGHPPVTAEPVEVAGEDTHGAYTHGEMRILGWCAFFSLL